MLRYYIIGILIIVVTVVVVMTQPPLGAFVMLWMIYGVLLSFGNNSASILNRRNIPFKARGYTADMKSVRAIIESHKEDKLLVKQLKRAVLFHSVSAALLISWMIVLAFFILLSNYLSN